MSFCPNCGRQVDDTMRFCPACGAALAAGALTGTVSGGAYETSTAGGAAPQGGDYRLVLISCGACSLSTARELLRNTFGYSEQEAAALTSQVPIEIAQFLSFQQALDLSRMFTEYGMQIAVYNSGGYVDISQYATSSVFDSSGSILKTAAVTLASLTIANRVRQFLRWTQPNPLRYLFTPRYRYQTPPPPPPRQPRRPVPPPPPQRRSPVGGAWGRMENPRGGTFHPGGGPGPGGRRGGGPGGRR